MIKISEKHTNCICDNCKKEKNKFINIHTFNVANNHFNLCTTCMNTLHSVILDELSTEFSIKKKTEEDLEIESRLKVLFNRRINDDWSEDCEAELNSIDFSKLSNCNKVIYKQIKNW